MKTVPIKFKGTDCPACGSKDSIRYIGRNSKAVEDMNETMLGSYEVKCMNCDHKYILKWKRMQIFEEIFMLHVPSLNFLLFFYFYSL